MTSCGNQNDKQINSIEEIKKYDYNLGVLQGTYSQEEVPNLFPKSRDKDKIFVYEDVAGAYRALQQGKIDVLFQDNSVARVDLSKGIEGVKILDGKAGGDYNVGIGISEQADYKVNKSDIDSAILSLKNSGIIDDMANRWIKTGDYDMPTIEPSYKEGNPVLKVATSGVSEPFTFYKNGEITGLDVELSKRIANILQRPLEFVEESNYASLTTEVQSGKAHLLIAHLYETEERRQALPFSIPYYQTHGCAIVRDYSSRKGFNSLSDLAGKKIGYDASSTQYHDIATKYLQNPELITYNSVPDCAVALLNNRIDGYICDSPIARYACVKNENLKILPEYVANDKYGFVLRKDSESNKLLADINTAINEFKTKGILANLEKKWFDPEGGSKTVTPQQIYGARPVEISTTAVLEPMNFVGPKGEIEGFELDLLYRIGDAIGVSFVCNQVYGDVSGLLGALESEKIDLAFNTISITNERKEKYNFSEPYYDGAVVIVVRNENEQTKSFWEKLADSFRKTFVVEERWKMILSGLAVTLVISVVAGILGIAIGAGICAIRRSKAKVARGISAAFIHIIQGTPAVVLLMILYYVVFGKINIDAIAIATLGFAIMFGVYSSEIMRSGFDSIDKGQIEAALALGYSRRQAFMKVSLPQASYKFIPVLTGEFISMVKMTSIAGYISVAELTRVGDIIRSKTMEAFFPLIVIALIYFGLCELLTFGLRLLHKKLDPKNHAKKVKGVYVINEEVNDWS